MVQIIKKISLEVSKPNLIQAIVAKQYDNNSRFLQVTLMHEGKKIEIAPTSTVTINAKRNDGEEKSFAGEANNDGTATVPLTYWMLELEGEVWCDVSVVDTDGRKLSSTKFDLQVEKASCSNGDITEDENYDVLVKLIEDVNKAKPELKYDPTSENAQSGIAVAQAMSGVNGIKYIAESVEAKDLDFGIYFIDVNSGAEVTFYEGEFVLNLDQFLGSSLLYEGVVIVSPTTIDGWKAISAFTLDVEGYYCLFNICWGNGKYFDKDLITYASQRYVDKQIALLREEIGGIENGSY